MKPARRPVQNTRIMSVSPVQNARKMSVRPSGYGASRETPRFRPWITVRHVNRRTITGTASHTCVRPSLGTAHAYLTQSLGCDAASPSPGAAGEATRLPVTVVLPAAQPCPDPPPHKDSVVFICMVVIDSHVGEWLTSEAMNEREIQMEGICPECEEPIRKGQSRGVLCRECAEESQSSDRAQLIATCRLCAHESVTLRSILCPGHERMIHEATNHSFGPQDSRR